ncbi:MAG: hypothetical protein ACW98D_15575 [Promethearchaeota archaeon]
MSVEKVKKGPVCYVYYTIKKKRRLKLERENKDLESKEISTQTEIILNRK